MIFVDASALVCMIAGERESDALTSCIKADNGRLVSAISAWETVAALCRSHRFPARDARRFLADFLQRFDFVIVPIGEQERDLALDAYERYGRGRHPAALNMGDCFSYACAKSNAAALLYKGHDFARTDLAWPRYGLDS